MNEYLTVSETQQELKISRSLAYKLISNATLPSVRLGKCIRVPRSSLDGWVKKKTNPEGD